MERSCVLRHCKPLIEMGSDHVMNLFFIREDPSIYGSDVGHGVWLGLSAKHRLDNPSNLPGFPFGLTYRHCSIDLAAQISALPAMHAGPEGFHIRFQYVKELGVRGRDGSPKFRWVLRDREDGIPLAA